MTDKKSKDKDIGEAGFMVSHPVARKKATGWGTGWGGEAGV